MKEQDIRMSTICDIAWAIIDEASKEKARLPGASVPTGNIVDARM